MDNIYYNQATGKHSAMFADKAAWHKLGTVVKGAQTWQDTIQLAGLNWGVEKHQLEYNGQQVPAWGIFRDDNMTFLGAVGNQYTPIQNQYCFGFVDSLLESADGAHYESAGVLGSGQQVWCLARIPYDFSVGGSGDKHQTYLLFTTSHDGSRSAQCKVTTVRVVCQNTLNQALSMRGMSLRVKHTKDAEARLEKAKKLMQGAHQNVKTLQDKLNMLASRVLTKDTYLDSINRIFPASKDANGNDIPSTRRDNVLLEVTRLFEHNDGNQFPEQRGTAYNLLNAVTEYTDHFRSARITEGRKEYTVEQARAENSLFGTGDRLKTDALERILEATQGCQVKTYPTYNIPTGGPPITPTNGILGDIADATLLGSGGNSL